MKYIPGHSFTANFAANNNPSIKARSAGKQKKDSSFEYGHHYTLIHISRNKDSSLLYQFRSDHDGSSEYFDVKFPTTNEADRRIDRASGDS